MNQTPFVLDAARVSYLQAVKTPITHVHLVKNFLTSDSFSTVTGVKSVANTTMAQSDMAITDDGDLKKLTFNPKSNLTKTNDSEQYFNGTATAGSDASITVTGETFPDYSGKVVHITDGTGVGESAKIISNTAETLTFSASAFTVALDATSKFVILDDLSIAYVSGTDIVYVADESTDKAITAASADQVNISAAVLQLPKAIEVAV